MKKKIAKTTMATEAFSFDNFGTLSSSINRSIKSHEKQGHTIKDIRYSCSSDSIGGGSYQRTKYIEHYALLIYERETEENVLTRGKLKVHNNILEEMEND